MTHRSPTYVLFISFITMFIYYFIWLIKTKNEMNQRGANIPSAWLLIIPPFNLWWQWKYAKGVALVTKNQTSARLAFLLFFLGPLSTAMMQSRFNRSNS